MLLLYIRYTLREGLTSGSELQTDLKGIGLHCYFYICLRIILFTYV
jgi:hypothetical protein